MTGKAHQIELRPNLSEEKGAEEELRRYSILKSFKVLEELGLITSRF